MEGSVIKGRELTVWGFFRTCPGCDGWVPWKTVASGREPEHYSDIDSFYGQCSGCGQHWRVYYAARPPRVAYFRSAGDYVIEADRGPGD